MHALHLASRKASFEVEVQTDQGKRQRDRLCLLIRPLRGPCIHDVLVDEGWMTVRERIALQLLVRVLEGLGGVQDRYRGAIASTRNGLPLPPTIFSGAAMTIAPTGGN